MGTKTSVYSNEPRRISEHWQVTCNVYQLCCGEILCERQVVLVLQELEGHYILQTHARCNQTFQLQTNRARVLPEGVPTIANFQIQAPRFTLL
jgi:hypothetical protein